jgi:tetratricopeptide (TPR) repeat protein
VSLSRREPNAKPLENAALGTSDQALALKARLAEALVNLGNALKNQNRISEALAIYEKAIGLFPENVEALNGRGDALMCLRRPDEALASYDTALTVKPDSLAALNNRGNALRDLRRPLEALASYDRVLELKPALAETLNNRGGALADLKRFDEALADYERALALKSNFVEALVNRGGALRELKRAEEALASCDAALALQPNCAEAHNNRSNALMDLGRTAEALTSCDRALALKPDYAEAYEGKGIKLMFLGRFEDAVKAIETAIGLAPRRPRFYYNLTLAKRLTAEDRHLAAMEDLARDIAALDLEEQHYLHFALGKAFADIAAHERSFEHFLAGNAVKRKQTNYSGETISAVFERTRAAFDGELMSRSKGLGEPSSVPVFILGMPRSGTTLVEQLLASHPAIFAAGERNDFSALITQFGGERRLRFPELALSISADELRQLGEHYVERIRAAAPDAARITDKMTENFRFVGLIHLALPNARIIHLRRNPVDTCLSCFTTLFYEDLNFTYDLKELGAYYREYETLMTHWRAILPPGVMIDVQYEDVVADLEGQARRIVAHCGLEWDVRCLDFHQTERAVRTASMGQVRRPIYKTSIGRWRAYEKFLTPLLEELRS